MPVYFFPLIFTENINLTKSILLLAILNLLLYPSSNGYNSYMDRDTTSIGGIKHPLLPTYQLFVVSICMDLLCLFCSLLLSPLVTICLCCYMLFSRLYSWRKIRLKKYPIIGYLTVVLNQGALVFFLVLNGVSTSSEIMIPYSLLLAASLLIGGFYPITQIYQHEADQKDQVNTLSLLLGKRGTFFFCLVLYITAFSILFFNFKGTDNLLQFFILQLFFIPVIYYFLGWFIRVWKNEMEADFTQTMRMNWIASICTNAAFVTLLILKHFG